MKEFESAAELLKALGLGSVFAPVLSILILAWITKKYLFNGFGGFLKQAFADYITHEKDRIKIESGIQIALSGIVDKLDSLMQSMSEDRKYYDQRISVIEKYQREHISAFKELSRTIKKRKEDWVREEMSENT